MFKKIMKKVLWVLLLALVAIQFFRPAQNQANGPEAFAKDISTVHAVPANVQGILQKACNDCHSNHTNYPWYSQVQPIAWWLANHINEGKGELNLSEYAGYSLRRRYHKLEELAEQVQENHMPLDSYTWMHQSAVLNDTEKQTLINWATALRDSMRQVYPIDSLERKKK